MLNINCGLIFFIFQLFLSHAYEYCSHQDNLCEGKLHIACMHRVYHSYKTIVPFVTEKMRARILDDHNYFRNYVASGNAFDLNSDRYPEAAQMHQLMWDYELEHLATLTVRHCKEAEDVCQNTFRFPNVGQNFGIISIPDDESPDIDPITSVSEIISSWSEKHMIVNRSNIEKFAIDGREFVDYLLDAERRTFLLMASDRIKQVGCSLDYCIEDKTWQIYVACNYSDDIAVGDQIYKVGKPGEGCESMSETYDCLCQGETKPTRGW